MPNLSPFCTCTNLAYPLHPTKHDKRCAPCMAKNLKLKEVPSCLFNTMAGAERRAGDSYEDFAGLILKKEH